MPGAYVDGPQMLHDFGYMLVGDAGYAGVVQVHRRRWVLGFNVLGDREGVHDGFPSWKSRGGDRVWCEASRAVGWDEFLEDGLHVGVFGPLRAVGEAFEVEEEAG